MQLSPLNWPADFAQPTLEDWVAVIRKELKQAVYEDTLIYELPGGGRLPAAVTAASARRLPDLPAPGWPGWELAQAVTLGTEDLPALNQALLFLLEHGAEALFIRLPYAEVFQEGAPVRDYLAALDTVLKGVIPGYIRLHFYAGAQTPYLMKAFVQWMQQNGHDPATQQGTFIWDPLSLAMWAGHRNASAEADLQQFARDLSRQLPAMTLGTSNAYLYSASGATPVQELAFGLCALFAQAQPALQQAIRVSAGKHFLLELAKFRALPVLWQRLAPRHAPHLADALLEVQASTALWNQAATDPHNNLVRNTLQALSAVLGGARVVDVQPHNQLTERNDAMGLRLAKNIQLLFKEESHLAQVADPARGSYVLESLTTSIVEATEALADQVMAQGGMWAAATNGWAARQINEAKARLLEAFAQKQEVVVGVNKYVTSEPRSMPPVFNPRVPAPEFPTIAPLRLS
ncbi:MAG: hypothetical protein KF690_04545 [Bacteroidetes bacterium]|nr:hypothetical protein [Bacteroidota bacterium]